MKPLSKTSRQLWKSKPLQIWPLVYKNIDFQIWHTDSITCYYRIQYEHKTMPFNIFATILSSHLSNVIQLFLTALYDQQTHYLIAIGSKGEKYTHCLLHPLHYIFKHFSDQKQKVHTYPICTAQANSPHQLHLCLIPKEEKKSSYIAILLFFNIKYFNVHTSQYDLQASLVCLATGCSGA